MADNNDGQQQTGAQGETGGQQGSQQPSGQPQQQSGQQQVAQNQPQGQPDAQSRPGAQSGAAQQEDRSRWIHPDHFNRVNARAQKAAELEAQLQAANKRIQALAGVEPTDPKTEKATQIEESFLNLPRMARIRKLLELPDDDFDRLLEAPQQVQQVSQAENRQWQRHGDAQISAISERVAEALGADALDEDQQSDLRVAFSAWLRKSVAADVDKFGLQDPAESRILQRYEAGDPKLLDEFVTRYTKNWVTPGRRQSAAQNANRTRPVPNSAGRSQVTQVRRPEKFNSLDERLDYGIARLKEQGVQFGR